jgi:hypothetical protein
MMCNENAVKAYLIATMTNGAQHNLLNERIVAALSLKRIWIHD